MSSLLPSVKLISSLLFAFVCSEASSAIIKRIHFEHARNVTRMTIIVFFLGLCLIWSKSPLGGYLASAALSFSMIKSALIVLSKTQEQSEAVKFTSGSLLSTALLTFAIHFGEVAIRGFAVRSYIFLKVPVPYELHISWNILVWTIPSVIISTALLNRIWEKY